MNVPEFDLIVIGAGIGGLATAVLAQSRGLRVGLLESHTKLGGCAGYFARGPYHFDAGATALMGLNRGEPIGDLLATIGVDFEGVLTPSYRVCLPDRDFSITPDSHAFEAASAAVFPGQETAKRRFWRLQESIGNRLFQAATKIPHLPLRTANDAIHDLHVLGLKGLLAAATSLVTVEQVLKLFRLNGDLPFRSLVAMLLQDTAQAGPETVPFANAAACLQAYRLGMSRPRGGMRSLGEGIGSRFAQLGGDLRTGTIVDRVDTHEDGFLVTTRRRDLLRTRQVAFNLPLDLAASLLNRDLNASLRRNATKSQAVWSAFTGYIALQRRALDDNAPLFHQVLLDYNKPIHDGNNVLVSLSPVEDEGYGPTDCRVVTMSTHTRPEDWAHLNRTDYKEKKAVYGDQLLAALRRAIPEAVGDNILHAEFATPKSFARYTRRTNGAVGGPPVSRKSANFLAVGSDVLGPNLWLVGDSVFPGQGTMAVVLSAIRVVERITGESWENLKKSSTLHKASVAN